MSWQTIVIAVAALALAGEAADRRLKERCAEARRLAEERRQSDPDRPDRCKAASMCGCPR